MNYKNIYKQNGKYVIKKNIYSKTIVYGSFDNLEVAIEQRNLLIKNKWQKNKTTKYSKNSCFPKYNIRKTEFGYLIINKKTGKTYGTYKNRIYAKIIKRILPFYEDQPDIVKIEQEANREFYRYITYNKITGRYHVNYKGFVRSSHKQIIEALNERDLILKYDGDEELMCENPTTINNYEKEELPSFYYAKDNIRYRSENRNKYQLEKQIRNKKIVIGSYPTYNLARLIKKYLENRKWDKNDMKRIIKATRQIHKRDKYIHRRNNNYYIERKHEGDVVIYAYYKDIELARYVKTNLAINNWNAKLIKKFEKMYYLNDVETKYYYDSTDFFT